MAAVAALPFAVAAIRAGASWVATGDIAVIVLRAGDVLGRHTPLVGMPTSLGLLVGRELHHPGPSEFWYLRLVQAVLPASCGPMVGTAALGAGEAIAVVGAAWVTAGRRAAAVTAVVASTVVWSLGGVAVLPWNPYVALFALCAFLASAVAVVRGRRCWLVGAVVFGSLAAQAQLAMVLVVAAATAGAVAASFGRWRRDRAWVAPASVAALAGVVLWAPVLWDQVAGGGNLSSMLAAGGGTGAVVAPKLARSVVANTVGGAVWARPLTEPPGIVVRVVSDPSPAAEIIAAAVVAALLLVALVGRRRAPTAAAAAAVALGALAGGVFAVLHLPDHLFTVLALHNYLWAWPVGASTAVLAGAAVVRRAPRPIAVGLLAVALLTVSVRTVAQRPPFPAQERWAPAIAPAVAALDARTAPRGTYLVDLGDGFDAFGVGAGVVLGLERAGRDVRVPRRWVPSFGTGRSLRGATPAAVYAVQVDGQPAVNGRPVFSYRLPAGGTVVIVERGPAGP